MKLIAGAVVLVVATVTIGWSQAAEGGGNHQEDDKCYEWVAVTEYLWKKGHADKWSVDSPGEGWHNTGYTRGAWVTVEIECEEPTTTTTAPPATTTTTEAPTTTTTVAEPTTTTTAPPLPPTPPTVSYRQECPEGGNAGALTFEIINPATETLRVDVNGQVRDIEPGGTGEVVFDLPGGFTWTVYVDWTIGEHEGTFTFTDIPLVCENTDHEVTTTTTDGITITNTANRETLPATGNNITRAIIAVALLIVVGLVLLAASKNRDDEVAP